MFHMGGLSGGWIFGRMDSRTDGRSEGWTVGQLDGWVMIIMTLLWNGTEIDRNLSLVKFLKNVLRFQL